MPSPIINDRFTALALMNGLQPQRILGNRAAVGAIWAMTASPTSIIAGRQVHMMGSSAEAMTIVGEDKEWGSHRRMVTRQQGNNQHRHRRQPFNLQPRGSAVGTMFDKLFNYFSFNPTHTPILRRNNTFLSFWRLFSFCLSFHILPAYNLLPFKPMVQ